MMFQVLMSTKIRPELQMDASELATRVCAEAEPADNTEDEGDNSSEVSS